MNKFLSALLVALPALSALADQVPGMLVHRTDGTQVEVPIAQIRSIRFSDGQMVISQRDDTCQAILLDQISQISFGSITEAIESLTLHAADRDITITDLSGRVLYSGPAQSDQLPTTLRGACIIIVDGVGHKVTITTR